MITIRNEQIKSLYEVREIYPNVEVFFDGKESDEWRYIHFMTWFKKGGYYMLDRKGYGVLKNKETDLKGLETEFLKYVQETNAHYRRMGVALRDADTGEKIELSEKEFNELVTQQQKKFQ